MPSVILQFDDDDTDVDVIKTKLKAAGLKIVSVTSSRWRDEDGNDTGGRIDVEVMDEAGDHKSKVESAETEYKKIKKKVKL